VIIKKINAGGASFVCLWYVTRNFKILLAVEMNGCVAVRNPKIEHI